MRRFFMVFLEDCRMPAGPERSHPIMDSTLHCPCCVTAMQEKNFGACLGSVCIQSCGGLWFDASELDGLDHSSKGAGPALTEAVQVTPRPKSGSRSLACPHCRSPLECEHHELAPEVEIDVCPDCSGVFLDAGELAALRARPQTPAELRAYRLRTRKRRTRRELRKRDERNAMLIGLVGTMIATS
jgi:Zn-finger nucleic acid-binding protein